MILQKTNKSSEGLTFIEKIIKLQRKNFTSYYCQRHESDITIVEEEERQTLWNQKLEEIISFQRERPMPVSYTHLDVYKRQLHIGDQQRAARKNN